MKPYRSRPLTPIEGYMYRLKRRARLHHCIGTGVFPVELTELHAVRRRYSREIRPVTLFPFFVKAVALAVRATPEANRVLFRRLPFGRRIAQFDVVDVSLPVTRTIDGEPVTIVATIRNADGITVAAIQDELVRLQRGAPERCPELAKLRRLESAHPALVWLYHWLMTCSPAFYLRNAGTCGITTLDGIAGGFFCPIGPTTVLFGIGGAGDQVVARDGRPAVRPMLDIALAIDNYVLPGLGGLTLARRFQALVESCTFVHEEIDRAATTREEPPTTRSREGDHHVLHTLPN